MTLTNFQVVAAILTLAVLIIAAVGMGLFGSRNHFPLEGRTAVVTGGSQGLGLSISKQLATKGASVVIVAQDVTKLQAASIEIQSCAKSSHQRFHHLSYDLRSSESAPQIIDAITSWNNGRCPDILFCCAGHCLPGFFASSSVSTLRSQMDTIYWSCAYMAHATLNSWLRSTTPTRTRHIIFTSSALAFYPLAGYAAYSPAKAAMRALADTLTQETAVYNGANPSAEIKVHTLFPMGILTPGFENEMKTKPALTVELEKEDVPQTPDKVAEIVIARLEAGDGMITTMFVGHLMRGWGLAGSARNGVVDLFWNMLGSIVILFVAPDYMAKCRRWGKEKGIEGAR